MRIITLITILFLLTSCVTRPDFMKINGGQRMQQHGVSFVPPTNKSWSILVQQSYKTTLAVKGDDDNESIIIAVSMFNIEKQKTKDSFLAFIKNERGKEPATGRYEVIDKSLSLYNERKETCVKYTSSSKDFGSKRSNKYTIYETFGMYCIHPNKPKIGVFIELSRKAPIGNKNTSFNSLGEELLKSVVFNEFRV